MVQKELDSGQLVKAWHYTFKGMGGYYLAYPCNKESTPKVKIIIQWIKNYLEKTDNEKMECSEHFNSFAVSKVGFYNEINITAKGLLL